MARNLYALLPLHTLKATVAKQMSPLERHLSQQQKHLQRDLWQPGNLNQGVSIVSDRVRNPIHFIARPRGYLDKLALVGKVSRACKANKDVKPTWFWALLETKPRRKIWKISKAKQHFSIFPRQTLVYLHVKLRPHYIQGNDSRGKALPSLAQLPCMSWPFYCSGKLHTPAPQHRHEGLTCNKGWGDFWQDTLLCLQKEH